MLLYFKTFNRCQVAKKTPYRVKRKIKKNSFFLQRSILFLSGCPSPGYYGENCSLECSLFDMKHKMHAFRCNNYYPLYKISWSIRILLCRRYLTTLLSCYYVSWHLLIVELYSFSKEVFFFYQAVHLRVTTGRTVL